MSQSTSQSVVRLSTTRFLPASQNELVEISVAQQDALRKASLPTRDRGWAISGFVGTRTTEALRSKGLLTPHAYALSPLGVEIRDFLVREHAR